MTDADGMFDERPRSLAFRFVLACAGVLGIGADITRWTDDERANLIDIFDLHQWAPRT